MRKKVVHGLVFSVIPIILFYLMEGYEHNAFEEVRPLAQVYNILLFELIAWFLFFATGNGKWALRIETVVAFLYGLVNHYVMAFRSTPFVPWDVFSIQTAASVAGNYDFTPSKEVVCVSIGFLLIFIAARFVKLKFESGLFLRIIPTVCVSLVLGTFVTTLWDDAFQTKSFALSPPNPFRQHLPKRKRFPRTALTERLTFRRLEIFLLQLMTPKHHIFL